MVLVRELCKSRPSESISSRRELQNLTSDVGSRCSPRRPWKETFALARSRCGMTWLSGSSFRRGERVALSDGATRSGEGISPKRDNARSIGVLSDSVSLRKETFALARSRCGMTWLSGSSFRRGERVALSDGATRSGEGISPKRDNV
ncbi:hypothetical protein DEO72_LG7g730 [Vigna unguiculata]|uniref:Uncharacterized protein n=1 Tax=Vigna unguiculata TaxID=3917 RepID=A0A4D6MDG0_VIGUN|nr:hypothetical protein DEO72_LG7g730 [Vigna unguiculata]